SGLIEQAVRLIRVVVVPVGGLLTVSGSRLTDRAVAVVRDHAVADRLDDALAVEAVDERLAQILIVERRAGRVERDLLRTARSDVFEQIPLLVLEALPFQRWDVVDGIRLTGTQCRHA